MCIRDRKKGITVTYAAGQNAVSVAELAFSLLMSVVKNLSKFNTHVKKGIWDRELQYELYGKTIGLYGFGNIAQKFAEMLAGFHVNILAYDPYFNKERADERNVIYADVDTLLTHSDVISLHIPGFREHSHIINESALSMMKQNSILINTARGNLIDLTALQKALDEQHLLGAGLDCFEIEPITDPLPLFRHERVVCTPHCGGKTLSLIHIFTFEDKMNYVCLYEIQMHLHIQCMMVICRIIPISLKCKGIPNLILQPFENFSTYFSIIGRFLLIFLPQSIQNRGITAYILHMLTNGKVYVNRKGSSDSIRKETVKHIRNTFLPIMCIPPEKKKTDIRPF